VIDECGEGRKVAGRSRWIARVQGEWMLGVVRGGLGRVVVGE
jgi:hypothetical protein